MRRTRIIAALILLTLLAGVGAVLTSETAFRWAADAAVKRVPRLEVTGVEGRLLTGVSVDTLRWRAANGVVLEVERVSARWRILPALTGRLHIPQLDAGAVTLRLPAPPGERVAREPGPRRMPPEFELPVHLRIAALHVGQFTLHRGDTRLARLDDVRGESLVIADGTIEAGRLAARGTPLDFELSGAVQTRGDWTLRLDAAWRFAADGWPEVDAETRAAGSLRRLEITQSLDSDAGTAMLDGVLADPVTVPAFTGTLRVRGLRPGLLHETWPRFGVDADLTVDGWIEDLAAAGDLRVELQEMPAMQVRLRADWGPTLLVVQEAVVRPDGSPVRVQASGRYDWSEPAPRARAEVAWQSLQWPLTGEGAIRSTDGTMSFFTDAGQLTAALDAQAGARADGRIDARIEGDWPAPSDKPRGRVHARWRGLELAGVESAGGEATVRGEIDAWHGTLDAQTSVGGVHDMHFALEASGDADGARIAPFNLRTPGGDVRGDARVGWRELLQFAFSARTDALDTGALSEAWPGRVSVSLDGEATDDGTGTFDWRVSALNADGTLRGRPLRARATAHGRGAALSRIDAHAEAGDAVLRVEGRTHPDFAIQWVLDAPDLAALLPGAGGVLHSDGEIRGEPSAPSVHMTVAGERLRWRDNALDALDLRVDGRSDAVRIEATAARAPVSVSLDAAGAWEDGTFTGRLQDVEIAHLDEPPWTLHRPAGFSAGTAAARLDEACWRQDGDAGRVCVAGAWRADTDARVRASLAALPLSALGAWLPPGIDYGGRLSGDAAVDWAPGASPAVSGTLSVSPGALRQTVRDERITLLAWREASLQGDFNDGDLGAAFAFSLEDGGDLRGDMHLPVIDTPAGEANARPMRARVTGDFSDFDLVPAFFPEIGSVSGRVRVDLAASGTLDDPVINGTLDIADGTATIPRLGIRLGDMRLSIDGNRDEMRLAASARSGPGVLSADGSLTVRDGKATGRGTLRGEDFEVANIPEARVRVTPRVEFAFEGHDVTVDGEVRIPDARIEPRDFRAATTPSPDQVLVDDLDTTDPLERWRSTARIRLVLGDDVRFDGFGLSGRIAGDLTVTDTPDAVTRASGELNVLDGRYRAWGQELEIERGRLLYTGGPITQPGLDIRAVRRPRDVLVGANIRGTLVEPEMTIFSEPPMPQSEALSWLVLGQPMTQAGGSEQELLDRTTGEVGLAGGELLLGELTRRLGIGGVGIERGDTPDDVTLMIGRYLSPRLYIAYGIGLFEPGNTVRMRYEIDRNWNIEAESGPRASGTDLLYTIER